MSGTPAAGSERPERGPHGGQDGRSSKLRRRRLVAATVVALLVAGTALLLWPGEPKPKPPKEAALRIAPEPPPPFAVKERAKAKKERPKRRAAPKRPENPKSLRVRVDRKAASPVAVTVPAVGISAGTIPLGLKPDGRLEVPTDYSEAGWREGGPEPGERGAAMITAHVDSRSGPAAFYDLRNVSPGADIEVRRRDGSTVTFVAQRTERVRKDDFPTKRVYGETRLPTLRLVTCGGSFDGSTGHYRDNLIVYATRKPS